MITILCPCCGQPVRDWEPYRIVGRLHIIIACCDRRWQVPVQGEIVMDARTGEARGEAPT